MAGVMCGETMTVTEGRNGHRNRSLNRLIIRVCRERMEIMPLAEQQLATRNTKLDHETHFLH